ncbi:MAG: enoyl-[acyl-carrier-protein] reductase [Polyangiaceae bacterium]|nr:enoyl-[acyl-carrier-protein] reductase [Polyangiaceae bacterium]
MPQIDLRGKRALVAGVADAGGFGFAIAKALYECGAKVSIASWPPAMGIFETMWKRGKFDDARQLSEGHLAETELMEIEKIYPLDALYDSMEDVPEDVKSNKRYSSRGDFTIQGLSDNWKADFGEGSLDILVHSLANGPEVHLDLIETSRKGYLSALSASSYSLVSMCHKLCPLMNKGGSVLSLSYLAAQQVIHGYGGGMSTAKAALEADTRYLGYQLARRYGVRINAISAGPFASRAANATGVIKDYIEHYREHAPLQEDLTQEEVANFAAFICSPLGSGMTGTTVMVDKGFHTLGMSYG